MYRKVAAEELARFLGVISHPERIRIIEELNQGELDVGGIQGRLKISQSTTSRHLSLLKAHHVVIERKEGRHVFYHLSVPLLSAWLISGLDIIQKKSSQDVPLSKVFSSAKKLWSSSIDPDQS